VGIPNPCGHPGAAGSFQREYAGDTELDRLLHHPGEPVTVTCRHRERQLSGPGLLLRALDFHRPLMAGLHQTAGASEAGSIQQLHDFPIPGAAHAEVMDLVVV
jgi:hypothetical protein